MGPDDLRPGRHHGDGRLPPFLSKTRTGGKHEFVIHGIYINPNSSCDLIGMQGLNEAGIGCNFRKNGETLFLLNFTGKDRAEVYIESYAPVT